MPVRSLCQKFFRDDLAPFHQYRQRAVLDATAALSRGASLTLTSIGRYLPGNAQVKNKIKRIDRLVPSCPLTGLGFYWPDTGKRPVPAGLSS